MKAGDTSTFRALPNEAIFRFVEPRPNFDADATFFRNGNSATLCEYRSGSWISLNQTVSPSGGAEVTVIATDVPISSQFELA